jgi:hypothetical protein
VKADIETLVERLVLCCCLGRWTIVDGLASCLRVDLLLLFFLVVIGGGCFSVYLRGLLFAFVLFLRRLGGLRILLAIALLCLTLVIFLT